MRVVVTGGSGFIGSNLVRHLVNTGHDVLNFDKLTYAARRASLIDLEDHPRYRLFHADICDPVSVASVMEAFRPEVVFHLAAESHVDRSIDSPGQFITTNIVGTYTLLRQVTAYWSRLPRASAEALRFVHVSTDEVFGSLGETDPAFNEQTPYDPRSPYAASKAGSDHMVRAWFHTYGLPTIVTNCSNNFGPYQYPEKLIPTVILKCIEQEPIPVYGDGRNIRDWLYVADHVHALELIAGRGQVGETYAIGGCNERANLELVQEVCAILDTVRPRSGGDSYADLIEFVPDRPGHDRRYAIDSSKIQRELGWRPDSDFASVLRATVEWYLTNKQWWEPILVEGQGMPRLGLAIADREGVSG